jgi:hypothetical protein
MLQIFLVEKLIVSYRFFCKATKYLRVCQTVYLDEFFLSDEQGTAS